MKPSLDTAAVLIAHALLLGLVLISVLGSVRAFLRRRKGAGRMTVFRGPESMGILYAGYGTTTVVMALLVQVAEVGRGSKAAIILFDYGVLTWLFFFSSWFRNRLIYPIAKRIKQD